MRYVAKPTKGRRHNIKNWWKSAETENTEIELSIEIGCKSSLHSPCGGDSLHISSDRAMQKRSGTENGPNVREGIG